MTNRTRTRRSRDELGYGARRSPCTFLLDGRLVDEARTEVGESELVRSIEAALLAAIDYKLWVREVEAGARDATD